MEIVLTCKKCEQPFKYSKGRKCSKETCSKCYVKAFRDRTKLKAIEYKGGKCIVCGYNKCPQALCFHHVNPTQKDFGISSGVNRNWNSIKEELDKCVLLCQNCHHEFHAGVLELNIPH